MKNLPYIIVTVLLSTALVLTVAKVGWDPHWLGHHYSWQGEGNFHRDIGECRAKSMKHRKGHDGGIDNTTFRHLMQGLGWEEKCTTCGEKR